MGHRKQLGLEEGKQKNRVMGRERGRGSRQLGLGRSREGFKSSKYICPVHPTDLCFFELQRTGFFISFFFPCLSFFLFFPFFIPLKLSFITNLNLENDHPFINKEYFYLP